MADIQNKLSEFISNFDKGGARANLYKVTVKIPDADTEDTKRISFLCKAASIPAATIGEVPVAYRGRQFKVAGDKTFEPWTLAVYNDSEYNTRNACEKWSQLIQAQGGNYTATDKLPITAYAIDATVEQLGRDGKVVATYTLHHAWPSNIGAIELSYESNDAVEEFELTLSYSWWTSEDGAES